jgi:hypothetical protein
MSGSESEPGLTFQWPAEKGFPFLLFFCVLGSVLAHGATFVLFQVVYPERVTIPQPAPHVSLLTPSSPENIALLRWIEAEDPALIASESPVRPPALVEVLYRPSFSEPRTEPLGAPKEAPNQVRFPPAIDRLAVRNTATQHPVAGAVPPLPTTVRFSGALASRPLTRNPAIRFSQQAPTPVRPSHFLVGVDASGTIRYQFLQESSGDAGLDGLGAMHLGQVQFAASEALVTWGMVAVIWGDDAHAPAIARVPAP